MSKLSSLLGKKETVKLGELEIEIRPLSLDEMEEFIIDPNASTADQVAAMKKLIRKVLIESIPDVTEEEISNLPVSYTNELIKAITEINKLDKPNVPHQIKR